MPNQRSVIHSDLQLEFGSQYFRYHLRMYAESLLWLQSRASSTTWDTVRNAVLEAHLVHARALINFLSKFTVNERDDDVLAVDYFHDNPNTFIALVDTFLIDQAKTIGGHLVHITTKSMPSLKSQQSWPIRDIATRLIPSLKTFLVTVSTTVFADDVKTECLAYLSRLSPPQVPVTLNAST